MKTIIFKQYCIEKSKFKRFVLPMLSWSKFFEVGFYDKDKFIIKLGKVIVEESLKLIKVILENDQIHEEIVFYWEELIEYDYKKSSQINSQHIHEYVFILKFKNLEKTFMIMDHNSLIEVIENFEYLNTLFYNQKTIKFI